MYYTYIYTYIYIYIYYVLIIHIYLYLYLHMCTYKHIHRHSLIQLYGFEACASDYGGTSGDALAAEMRIMTRIMICLSL